MIRRVPVRIRAGPNRGRLWSLAVSGRGTRSGTYELERFEAIAELVSSGDRVWDIGAHYGYAALVAARRAGAEGEVTCFEPSAFNRWYLERHLQWNGERVDVVASALADEVGVSEFGGKGGSVAFHLGGEGETVSMTTIDRIVAEGRPLPDVMKVDTEGAEHRILEGAREAFRRSDVRPLMMVSVHRAQLLDPCVAWASEFGYRVLGSRAIRRHQEGAPWHGDPDLLCVPPARRDDLDRFRALPSFRDGLLL
ncbi:MAG: FkbM family methyltransferase [Gemmatimonadota bacterium]